MYTFIMKEGCRQKRPGNVQGLPGASAERSYMIILDYRDTRPLYEQIVDKFQTLILKGVLEPNSRMPSVRSLAVELSINPNTIQRAYTELERSGFIYTVKGRGNFVAYDESLKEVRREEIFAKLDALRMEAEELGMTRQELSRRILEGGAQTAPKTAKTADKKEDRTQTGRQEEKDD